MLLNYNKCECCKNTKNDVSLTLHHLLPTSVCNKISEYIVYCNQCCIRRDREKLFLGEHKDKGYTKIQLQLKFFMRYQKRFPIHFYHKISRKTFEQEIDEFSNNKVLIKRFGGELSIKPYKSFV